MYYSLIDTSTNNILNCGLNSYTMKEIKKSILYYVKNFVEDKNEVNLLENTPVFDLSNIFDFRIFPHKNPLTGITRVQPFQDRFIDDCDV